MFDMSLLSLTVTLRGVSNEHCLLPFFHFHSSRIRTLVAMVTYSFHRLIMGKVELRNFYCLNGDDRILFLQKCLLNSSPHFIRRLSELLNLIDK